MSSDKLNLEFVNFVKSKKHAKPNDEDLYEIDFLGRKKEGISFNDTIRNEVKKPKFKEGELSLSDFLNKNKNKIIEEPKRKESINKEKNKKGKKEKNNDKEDDDNIDGGSDDDDDNLNENNSYDESEDYSEEKINHYIGGHKNKKNDIDEIEETIKEIQNRSQRAQNKVKNNEINSDEDNNESNEEEEENEDKNNKEKNNEENNDKNNIENNNKKFKKNKKKKKEFKSNISNTIFISNLPKNINENEIKKKFDKFGIIKNIRLIEDKKGNKKNFGYIDYETEKAMTNAINSKINIKENEIKIEKAKSSFFEGIDHTGGILDDKNSQRIGKKKQKAIINKAKENMKKNKE